MALKEALVGTYSWWALVPLSYFTFVEFLETGTHSVALNLSFIMDWME